MLVADTARSIGEIAGVVAILGGLYGIVRLTYVVISKLNEILDTTREAKGFRAQLDSIESAADTVAQAVTTLTRTTSETFAQRTADFQAIVRQADETIRDLQGEVAKLKENQARIEARAEAHSLEDDHRFERIETALADIKAQLDAILAAPGGPTPEPDPV